MDNKNNGMFRTVLTCAIIGGLVVLIAIYLQLVQMNDAKKVEFTNQFNDKIEKWEHENPIAEDWIYNINNNISADTMYYKYDLETYIGYYEEVYSLWQKDLIDKKLAYDDFSWQVESIYERNNGELIKVIKTDRIKHNDPEIFQGVENLYYEFMKKRKTITGTHNIIPKD